MKQVQIYRKQAADILSGRSQKKVIFVGPCSIHKIQDALDYAQKLKQLSLQVEDKLMLIMRVFLEKPRTKHTWKGFLHDPCLDGSMNLQQGIQDSLFLYKALEELDLPLATEFIDPNLSFIFEKYITWGFIGARTTRSPIHRQLASALECPIGFKNPLDGDLDAVTGAIDVASHSHQGFFADEHLKLNLIKTKGNLLCHGVLRGSNMGPNNHLAPLLEGPWIIDCAHGNSGKTVEGMKKAFHCSLIAATKFFHIKGLMLESFLQEGSQAMSASLRHGQSITDPCLSFEDTGELILKFYNVLSQSQGSASTCTGSSFKLDSVSENFISLV